MHMYRSRKPFQSRLIAKIEMSDSTNILRHRESYHNLGGKANAKQGKI